MLFIYTRVKIDFFPFVLVGQKSTTAEREEFKCPGHANGNYADPSTCRRFYQVNLGFLVDLLAFFVVLFNLDKILNWKRKILSTRLLKCFHYADTHAKLPTFNRFGKGGM